MALTKFTAPDNNVSDLPNKPTIPASTLKQKFDQIGDDLKLFINDVLTVELGSTATGNSGADNIGSSQITNVNGNTVRSQLGNLKNQIDGLVIGQIPDYSITEEKLAIGTTIPIAVTFGSQTYNKTGEGSKPLKISITGNHYTDANGYYVMTNPSVKVTCADGSVTQTVAEGRFFTGENPVVDNGKIEGNKLWREVNSRAIIPVHVSQTTDYKVVQLPVQFMQSGIANALAMNLTSLITDVTAFTGAGQFIANAGNIQFSVSNTLTGFVDGIAPNADEWTAYITKGWKATANNGTRYTSWVSAVDGTTLPTAQTIDFVKSTESPNYIGYQIAYQLATPEPMSDIDVKIEGGNLSLEKGINTIVVDNGIVLGEDITSTFKLISGAYYTGVDIYTDQAYSPWKFKQSRIDYVYKSGADNTSKWNKQLDTSDSWYLYSAQENFNTSATYTADYKILATQAPNIGTVALSYTTGLQEGLTDAFEQINNRQIADSTLDAIVDASLYEYISINRGVWFTEGAIMHVEFLCAMLPKKIKPKISVDNAFFYIGAGLISYTSKFKHYETWVVGKNVIIRYITTDTTAINDIKASGLYANIAIHADARGGRP